VGITTSAMAQDDQRQHADEHKDNDKKTRVYDRGHKDYHDWNENEDRSYHQYLTEQHKEDRDYSKLNRRQQDQYWNWRHNHPDDNQEKH
jgi:hypothetical protein